MVSAREPGRGITTCEAPGERQRQNVQHCVRDDLSGRLDRRVHIAILGEPQRVQRVESGGAQRERDAEPAVRGGSGVGVVR